MPLSDAPAPLLQTPGERIMTVLVVAALVLFCVALVALIAFLVDHAHAAG